MKKTFIKLLTGIIACLPLASCGPDPDDPEPEPVSDNNDVVWGIEGLEYSYDEYYPSKYSYIYDDKGRVVKVVDPDDGSIEEEYVYGEHKILFKNGGSDDYSCDVTDGLITRGGLWGWVFTYDSQKRLIKATDRNNPQEYFNFKWNGSCIDKVDFSYEGEGLNRGSIYITYKKNTDIHPSCAKVLNSMAISWEMSFLEFLLMTNGYFGLVASDYIITEVALEYDYTEYGDSDGSLTTFEYGNIDKNGCPGNYTIIYNGKTNIIPLTWKRL